MRFCSGSGLCIASFRSGEVSDVSDVSDVNDVSDVGLETERWPRFAAEALSQGFHSVHAVPLTLWDNVIGTLNLFRARRGKLSEMDAVAVAVAASPMSRPSASCTNAPSERTRP